MLQIAELERLAELTSKHPSSMIADTRFFLNQFIDEFKENGLFNQDGSFKHADQIIFFKIMIKKIMETCQNLSRSVNPSAPFWDPSKNAETERAIVDIILKIQQQLDMQEMQKLRNNQELPDIRNKRAADNDYEMQKRGRYTR